MLYTVIQSLTLTYYQLSLKGEGREFSQKSTWFDERNNELREYGQEYYGRKEKEKHWNYKVLNGSRVLKAKCRCKQRAKTGSIK